LSISAISSPVTANVTLSKLSKGAAGGHTKLGGAMENHTTTALTGEEMHAVPAPPRDERVW
jgi:hypothetical protein